MDSKVICTYKDWLFLTHNGKTYCVSFDDMDVTEVKEVARIRLTGKETQAELDDGLLIDKSIVFDSAGELDKGGIYCYWRNVDNK